jgi:hypothetical protein
LIDEVLSGGEPRAEALGVALDDLLDVMQSLNVEINGETPSESVLVASGDIPRAAAYAVSEVATRLRARQQPDAAWVADLAWNAILAGDIDDIRLHVQQERDAAR